MATLRGETSHDSMNTTGVSDPTLHAGIFMAGVSYSFAPGSALLVNGILTFSESPLKQLVQPHDYDLVLTLEVGRHLMKRILVDPSSAADLLYLPSPIQSGYKPDNLHNPGRVLVNFNGTLTHSLGEIVLPISAGPVTSLVSLIVIDELSNFNAILGATWIHTMKAFPSSYH